MSECFGIMSIPPSASIVSWDAPFYDKMWVFYSNFLSEYCFACQILWGGEGGGLQSGLGSSTVDQVLKYTKYPKYIPSTSTGQVLIFLKST